MKEIQTKQSFGVVSNCGFMLSEVLERQMKKIFKPVTITLKGINGACIKGREGGITRPLRETKTTKKKN